MATGRKFSELMQLTASVAPTKEGNTVFSKPKTAPGQMMEFANQRDEAIERAEKAEAFAKQLEEQLRQAKRLGGALELDLNELYEVPGRRRLLTPEEYDDLKNNLAHNPLASPITVRVRNEGGYEIVSGHNRVQIYRELDRKNIKAWLAEASDDEAEDLAFFANALAAKLPDYDKYRGYKRIMEKHPSLQQNNLAERVGISTSQLDRLLAFSTLPPPAHEILSERPHIIGANTAEKLAALVKKGREAQVIEALSKLANGELKQEAEAIRFANAAGIETKAAVQASTKTFKLGKSNYATLRLAKNVLRIDCMSEEEAQTINDAIQVLIEKRIADLKSK